jgi:formiminoglutamase
VQANFEFQAGDSPLLISIPHAGTDLPPGLAERLTGEAAALADTDWFVDRLYARAKEAGVGMIVAGWSRLLIDLNRPPDDAPLYDSAEHGAPPGLVPLTTFDGEAVYLTGKAPDQAEVAGRIKGCWQPYHRALAEELKSIRDRFGYALLLDAHSIRSQVPALFHGALPELNLGSNEGRSASASLIEEAWRRLERTPYTRVLDGRFKGGFITRHYGTPEAGIHALQLEIAQSCYMRESPPAWLQAKASRLMTVLESLLDGIMGWNPEHG